MKNDIQQERIRAVQRFLNGERPEALPLDDQKPSQPLANQSPIHRRMLKK
jgi:hypothetical protein